MVITMTDRDRSEIISALAVSGFKSLRHEAKIEVRPLTILAGANSSGKSSIMQPLLLLKQTLEATYDTGPLKIDGPHVTYTSANQFLSKTSNGFAELVIQITLKDKDQWIITNVYRTNRQISGLQLVETNFQEGSQERTISQDMSSEEILAQIPERQFFRITQAEVIRENAFLIIKPKSSSLRSVSHAPLESIIETILSVIHVPGLRTEVNRAYPSANIAGSRFIGRFENYAPGIILAWQKTKDPNLRKLEKNLGSLGLTSTVTTIPLGETQIEVQVGRTLQSSRSDTVNIADVGFGVSQVLPVLVALLVAEPGQLVYIEQPELHLHPRAQLALAQVLADAAERGVRIVIETHSDLLLLGIQTLVAEGKLASNKVILHWFTRQKDGTTQIASREPDKSGAYGDWPEDFGDVRFEAQSRYLDAAGIPELESE